MTRPVFAIALAAVAAVLAGSAALAQQSLTPSMDTQLATAKQPGAPTQETGDTTNRLDEKFLRDFAQINAAEIAVGKLAAEKSENSEVQAFAKRMVDKYSKNIGEVGTIANNAKVYVKAKPDLMQKAKAAMLNINVGGSFDRAYVKAMIDYHETVVEMLQKEIRDGHDASVKQFASQALSDVEDHLKAAQDLRAKLLNEEHLLRTASSRGKSSTEEKLAASP